MSQPTNRWKLGLFVLVGIGAVLFTIAWLGARSLQRDSTRLHVFFDQEVTGLEVGAPLYFRGIQIGKVAVIRAAPDRRHVEVLVEVFLDSLRNLGFLAPEEAGYGDGASTPPEDLRVQLVASFITGVATLESDFVDVAEFPAPDYPFPVPANTLHPIPSTLNQLEQGVLESVSQLPSLIEQAEATLARLEQTMVELDPAGLQGQASQVMSSLDEQIDRIYEMPFLQRGSMSFEELTATLQEIRAFVADLRDEDGSMQQLLANHASLTERVDRLLEESDVPGTLASLRETSGSFGSAGDAMTTLSADARAELQSLHEALIAARRLFELLERDPASLLRGR